jgi:hypothetical protein
MVDGRGGCVGDEQVHYLIDLTIELGGYEAFGAVGVIDELIIEGQSIVLKKEITAHAAPFQSL